MFDIISIWRNGRKIHLAPNGWYVGNAPCCVHRGESRDTRNRGGIKVDQDNWGFHCFNCGFTAGHTNGQLLSKNAKKLLLWLGVDEDTIQKLNMDSFKNRTLGEIAKTIYKPKAITKFTEHNLPDGSTALTVDDKYFVDYLHNRGLEVKDYPFFITPKGIGRNKNRIIIPYMYNNRVVGWTSRYLDKNKLKYKNENQQPGYIFGLDMQEKDWLYAIVTEGVLDAISIRSLAVMHNEFSETQTLMLKQIEIEKEIIIVPDQDKAGLVLASKAIEAGFSLSIPNWAPGIKDVNEAVQRYGKVGTLLSILHAKEHNKIKNILALNKLRRRLSTE